MVEKDPKGGNIDDEDPKPGSSTDRPPKEALKPDVVAMDGMLTMLNSTRGNKRSLSFGSQEQLNTEMRSLHYNENRLSLERWLTQQIDLLVEVQKFADNKDVFYPFDQKFHVLDLDIRLGNTHVGSSMFDKNLGQMLNQLLSRAISHSFKLRERIENTSSHVLITGDLNAGKSSLCNALLRRNVLPVDQQPCTDVFCEVIDYSQNDKREEVHAVKMGKRYARDDLTTYKIFALDDLDHLVHEDQTWSLLKVYLHDERDPAHSILCNGIVDTCLIDAPGLNVDVNTTTEVFGRQEEIDLVIFVVSAENHFTQSSKEFVENTSREKSLVFIVVNNYDKIRDKGRCKTRIMNQIRDLVPETHKGAGDFVHFVNSNNDPVDPDDNPHGPDSPDFDQLEARLRNFVLEKRSISKLAPARNYLTNTLGDLVILSKANVSHASVQYEDLSGQLSQLNPTLDKSISECAQVSEQMDKDIERLSHSVYTQSISYLQSVVDSVGDTPVVEYNGILDVFNYAIATRKVIVEKIQEAVHSCEENARGVTAAAVDAIKSLGVLHVGEKPAFSKVFQQSAMFSRKRDNLGRHIKAELSLTDFLDITTAFEKPLPVLQASKSALLANSASTWSNTLTLFSVVGGTQLVLGSPAVKASLHFANWVSFPRFKQMILPAIAAVVVALGFLIINEVPRTVPRKIARKVALEIDELGYVGTNANRISTECRKVLKFPAQDVRSAFQSEIESQSRQRDELQRHAQNAKQVSEFFSYVDSSASKLYDQVKQCNLELPVD